MIAVLRANKELQFFFKTFFDQTHCFNAINVVRIYVPVIISELSRFSDTSFTDEIGNYGDNIISFYLKRI